MGQNHKIHAEAHAEITGGPYDSSPHGGGRHHVMMDGRGPPHIMWTASISSICVRMYFLLFAQYCIFCFWPISYCFSGPTDPQNHFFSFPVHRPSAILVGPLWTHFKPLLQEPTKNPEAHKQTYATQDKSQGSDTATFRAAPLNNFFRPRDPKPYFPAPGPFKTGRGCVGMHLWW